MDCQVSNDKPSLASRHLARYEDLLALSGKMLDLATRGDWESLIDQELRYLAAVEDLQKQVEPVTLDAHQRERRAAMVEVILERALETQNLLAERMDFLSRLIEMTECKRTVDRAYLSLGNGEPGNLLS